MKSPFKVKEFYYIHKGKQYRVGNDFNLPAFSEQHALFMKYLALIVALQGDNNA